MSDSYRKPHKCHVCGQFEFPYESSYQFCDVCGWQDDAYQERHPNEDSCANIMSLNQARAAWAKGEPIE